MNARKVGQVLLIALPMAATSFLGAGYIKTAPATGFSHATVPSKDQRFACENGSVNGWLLVRFDPPLQRAPEATLSGHKPLATWLTTKDGVQWVGVADAAPADQQPKLFAWSSGVEMHLTLPGPSRVVDWTVHRDTEKPDSASAVVRRRLFAVGTFVLLLLSVVAAFVGPKIFETAEELDTKKYVRMLIDACEFANRAETEQARRLLRSVVLDGQTLDAAMAFISGDPKQKRLLAILAVGKLKSKLLVFHEELTVFKSRLERAR